MLGAEQGVEKLHGGDGDGGRVAVDALEQSGEEDGLVGGLAAEEANEELDEGRRRRRWNANRMLRSSTSMYPCKTLLKMESRIAE